MAYTRETTCCGLYEIAYVGESSDESILNAISAARSAHAGRCFATTTDGQHAKEKMERLGFEAIDRFRNPNTGHMVTFWLRPTRMPNALQRAKNALTGGRKK